MTEYIAEKPENVHALVPVHARRMSVSRAAFVVVSLRLDYSVEACFMNFRLLCARLEFLYSSCGVVLR